MMKLEDCRYEGQGTFRLDDYPTSAKVDKAERPRIEEKMADNIERMIERAATYPEGDERDALETQRRATAYGRARGLS